MTTESLLWASAINTPNNDTSRSISVFNNQIVGAFSTNASDGAWGEAVVRAFNKANGMLLWEKSFGTSDKTYVSGIAHSPDGFIYVTGGTREILNGQSYGGASDAWIARLSSNGEIEWINNFSNHLEDALSSLAVDSDGNAYMAGTLSRYGYRSGSGHYYSDYAYLGGDQSYEGALFTGNWMSAVRKVNTSGQIQWTRVDGSYNSGGGLLAVDGNRQLVKASYTFAPVNGQPMVPGVDNGNGANVNTYLISYSQDGSVKWTRMKAEVTAMAIDQSTHNIFIGNQGVIEKLSESGDVIWTKDLGSRVNDIATSPDGFVHAITGSSSNILKETVIDQSGVIVSSETYTASGSFSIGDFVSDEDGIRYFSGSISDGTLVPSELTAGGKSDAVIWSFGAPYQDPIKPVFRGNSLYTVVPGPSWTQAEANAVKLGGHLTAIGSEEENQFVWTEFGPSDTAANQKWIGLNDAEEEGTWRWSNGEEVLYTNWAYIAPANTSGISYEPGTGSDAQDYVNFWWGTNDGTWDDYFENGGWGPDNSKGIAEIPFIRHGDSAYVIVQGPTWEEAEANAVALGGHLVTINDAEENDWIVSTFIEPYNSNFFIGATDKVQEGVWQWTSGDSFSYANWYPGEPSNSDGGENYTVISGSPSNPERKGFWNDTKGTTPEFGLVEIELAPNNTPTGTPTISGDPKVGSTLTIDASDIQDLDNNEYWTPEYQYYWEVADESSDVSLDTSWSSLETEDAVDKNTTLRVTEAIEGRLTRGVVKYLDGYGTNETVYTDAYRIQVTYEQATSNAETVEIWTNETGLGAGINEPFKEPVATNSWFGNSRFARWFRRFNPAPQEPAEQPEPILPYDETAKGVVFTGADNGQTIKASGTFSTSERKSLEVPLIVDAGLGADEITGGNAQNWIQGGGVNSDQEVDELIGVSNTVDFFDLRSDDYSTDSYEIGSAKITNYGQEDYVVLSGSSEDYAIERLGGVVQPEPEPPQTGGWFSWFSRFRSRWSTPPAPQPPEPVSFDIKNAATNDLLANVRGDFMTTSTTVDDLNIQYGVTSSPRETMIAGEQLFA